MKINLTTTHELTFAVESFKDSEGGMDHDTFGAPVKTIEEAIALLGHARASDAKLTRPCDKGRWIITINVETKHSKD